MRTPSRRQLLASIGSTTAALSVAGCLDDTETPTGGSTTGSDSTTDTTTADPSTGTATETVDRGFRSWIPEPAALDSETATLYDADLAALWAHRDSLPRNAFENFAGTLATAEGPTLVGATRWEESVRLYGDQLLLVRTSLSESELAAALGPTRFSATGEYDGVTLYERSDATATTTEGGAGPGTADRRRETVAAVDGVLVRGFGPGGRDRVETVLDRRAGDGEGLIASSDTVPALYDRTSGSDMRVLDPPLASDAPPALREASRFLYAWELSPSETTFSVAAAYGDGVDRTAGELADAIASVTPDRYGGFEGTTEGEVTVTTGTVPTDSFDPFGGSTDSGSQPTAPQVSFDFEYDADAGTVTIAHAGGEAARADLLTVDVEGRPTPTQFTDEYDELTAGDGITVDVSGVEQGSVLHIVWTSPDGDAAQVIVEFGLP
ncbi:hypothetical protein [Haloarchaeobius salinus]|uniref:hypothetical protein n=1 Tax=Haloarchaeobius salinus TaxID=1198298 RepID=UPI0021087F0C|nr:hypothetical protein [Haloarchaeobius salinus]